MTGHLMYIGFAHDHAPLSVRERLRPSAEAQVALLGRSGDLAAERLLLSTCERFEFYAWVTTSDSRPWIRRLADWFSLPEAVLRRHTRVVGGDDVARHIMRVASGLESRIIGENQILGQLREAYLRALGERAMGPMLCALGRAALHAGKRVRHETQLSSGVRSLGGLTVRHLERRVGDLGARRIAVIGSGRLASEVATALVNRNAVHLTIVARDIERAGALAEHFDASVRGLGDLPNVLSRCDAAVVCTSAPSYVVDGSRIRESRIRPLHLVDLSVPRNVDPMIAGAPRVTLTHLDELVAHETRACAELAACTRIVESELHRYLCWQKARSVAPLIADLVRGQRCAWGRDARHRNRRLHQQIMRLKAGVAA